jgi:GNAT superfamily N-acetyltransferase
VQLEIKNAASEHEAAWRVLWGQYLAFYGVNLPAEVTSRTWARILDAGSRLNGRFAFLHGEMVGFALHHHHVSTWTDGDDCYLEDLYLAEAARGHGIGRALLDDLRAIAKAQGFKRLYWHTDEGNLTARRLYDSYTKADGHVRYRFKL